MTRGRRPELARHSCLSRLLNIIDSPVLDGNSLSAISRSSCRDIPSILDIANPVSPDDVPLLLRQTAVASRSSIREGSRLGPCERPPSAMGEALITPPGASCHRSGRSVVLAAGREASRTPGIHPSSMRWHGGGSTHRCPCRLSSPPVLSCTFVVCESACLPYCRPGPRRRQEPSSGPALLHTGARMAFDRGRPLACPVAAPWSSTRDGTDSPSLRNARSWPVVSPHLPRWRNGPSRHLFQFS